MSADGSIDRDALAEVGYDTVRVLDEDALRSLRARHEALGVDPEVPYWASSVHPDRATAQAVDRDLKAQVGPALRRLLAGHSPFLAAFITKGSGGGDVGLHPDWTYTDERRDRTWLCWCPLVDTDVANGTMWVLPASHRAIHGLRGSGDFPSPVEGIEADLLARHARPVPLAAGEALVYDAALVHGSGPNRSDRARPVTAVALAPDDAPLVHFHREGDGPVEGFVIDAGYYTAQPFGTRPEGYEALAPWDEPVRPLDPADLPAP
jgi:ectoine hydroxylase-related dioxygenase (phytanoyl-CoA dioxygenase family)